MIKDTPEGQTHYQNDGCGEPAHNSPPPKDNDYGRNYSHYHCWDQKTPACGQPLEKHKQCCLCDTLSPQVEKWKLCCAKCEKPLEPMQDHCHFCCECHTSPQSVKRDHEGCRICGKKECLGCGDAMEILPPIQGEDEWTEEFDSRFPPNEMGDFTKTPIPHIKAFIRQLLSSHTQAVLAKKVEEIREKLKKHARQNTYEDNEALVYKTTMKEVLDLLTLEK